MIRTFFRIPKVDSQIKDPSKALCPRCGSGTHVHGHKPRQVSDPKIEHARTQRRQCKACQKTFTLRPEGVGRGRATTRTRALAFIWYMLGLSYDGVVIALEAQGMSFSKQTVHHWIQALWAQANHLRRRVRQGTVRFLGLDGTVYQVQGRKEAVQIATDLVQGDVLGIELMAEEDAAAIQALLEQYKKKYHVELLTTDEAAVYGAAAEGAGLPHQLCRTHVKKALPHRARKILSQAQQQHHPRCVSESLSAFAGDLNY